MKDSVAVANYDPKRRFPLVIQTHGYQGDKFFADGYVTAGSGGRTLVARNIILLQMDMLLSHFSTPEESLDQDSGFEWAINQLTADGFVDRTRVGVIGFSRTAHHVLYALTHCPNLFATAMITSSDMSYLPYLFFDVGGGSEIQREAEGLNGGAPFDDGLLKWFTNAPGFKLDRTKAPLLITSFENGGLIIQWETFAVLRRLNKPVEMLWWWKENGPHVLVQPSQRYASQQAAVDWFDFWLNGHEDPDPAKAEQYGRWRQLRKLQQQNEKSSPAPSPN